MFQFTLPRGERPSKTCASTTARKFQFTLPRGERLAAPWVSLAKLVVSIHAPAGGATAAANILQNRKKVSIHAPAGGATRGRLHRRLYGHRFNSRSRGGSDRLQGADCGEAWRRFNSRSRGGSDRSAISTAHWRDVVSIHAPAGGATDANAIVGRHHSVSIHAPAGGATSQRATFQLLRKVSIHAPAGGATSHLAATKRGLNRFNSRSRGGSDMVSNTGASWGHGFQFTLPRGERHRFPRASLPGLRRFNSRSRGGSDSPSASITPTIVRFQFTLPRGERRPGGQGVGVQRLVSIHAPAGGATVEAR